MPFLNTVPQPEFFFHQFPIDLNTAGSPDRQHLAPIPTGGDSTDPSGHQTFTNFDAFETSSYVDYTATVPSPTNDPENAPTGVAYPDRHVCFENGNPTSQHAHARPVSVPVVANQALLPSQFQPFDAVELNIYNQPWPSTSTGVGYMQNNPTPLITLPSDNHRGHGIDGPVAPNGHHFAQAAAISPFEEQRVLGQSALVVIPGAPAFSIPIDVANVLLTVYQRQ